VGAVTCRKEKLAFLEDFYEYQPPDLQTSGSNIDWTLWEFLLECFEVLEIAASDRRGRARHIRRQQRSTEGVVEQINAEETVSDMDDSLGKFTSTNGWAALSNPSPSQ
jgi:hypothetical protein